ncbi:MAG: hypothetical protein QN173_07035 [Armatimonadota bacterium]|nr:hypothetical protein [Armatimonadota bacterium]MDR7515941.1 hypothetical protein [Armatimonadota bacterium]MDR7587033.1 hypothetical protein [Armatimonadota bacterium]
MMAIQPVGEATVMVVALLGVVLVVGGLYVLTRDAALWRQVQDLLASLLAALPPPVWHRVEYVAGVAALMVGAALILLRLFGGLRRI